MAQSELLALRDKVDAIDADVIELLAKRFEVTTQIGKLKARESLNSIDPGREANQIKRYEQLAASKNLNPDVVINVFRLVIAEVVRRHAEV